MKINHNVINHTMFTSKTLTDLCIKIQSMKAKFIFAWTVYNALAMKKYWQIMKRFASKLVW